MYRGKKKLNKLYWGSFDFALFPQTISVKADLSLTEKSIVRRTAVRETCISRYNGDTSLGQPDTLRTLLHYGFKGFKGNLDLEPFEHYGTTVSRVLSGVST